MSTAAQPQPKRSGRMCSNRACADREPHPAHHFVDASTSRKRKAQSVEPAGTLRARPPAASTIPPGAFARAGSAMPQIASLGPSEASAHSGEAAQGHSGQFVSRSVWLAGNGIDPALVTFGAAASVASGFGGTGVASTSNTGRTASRGQEERGGTAARTGTGENINVNDPARATPQPDPAGGDAAAAERDGRQELDTADKGKQRAAEPSRSKASSRRHKTRTYIESMEPETDPAKALKNFKEGLLSIEKKFRTLTKKNGGIGILLLAHPQYAGPRPKSEGGVIKRKHGVGYVKAFASSDFDKLTRTKIPTKSLNFGKHDLPLSLSSAATSETDTSRLYRTIRRLFTTYIEQMHEKEGARNAAGMKALRARLEKLQQESDAKDERIRQLEAQQGQAGGDEHEQANGERGPRAHGASLSDSDEDDSDGGSGSDSDE